MFYLCEVIDWFHQPFFRELVFNTDMRCDLLNVVHKNMKPISKRNFPSET